MKATHQIIQIHKEDSYSRRCMGLKGKRGYFEESIAWEDGTSAGRFTFCNPQPLLMKSNYAIFHSVTVKKL